MIKSTWIRLIRAQYPCPLWFYSIPFLHMTTLLSNNHPICLLLSSPLLSTLLLYSLPFYRICQLSLFQGLSPAPAPAPWNELWNAMLPPYIKTELYHPSVTGQPLQIDRFPLSPLLLTASNLSPALYLQLSLRFDFSTQN